MQLTGELEIIQLQARAELGLWMKCKVMLESVVLSIQTENSTYLHQHVKNEFKRPENKKWEPKSTDQLLVAAPLDLERAI